ncbi:acyl-CoA:lysophosphatidylglycerol acyltransferase 1-like isoform X1 [Phlebotomus papatasi]|uniref:acyl-CoA:lysophosphatidylglycerol acyltransferase 1-like isoform X1 n=1 Tax=Phlebotomus papatasi TaxID=29031 RepID=UPI0024846C0C|nr:acyl-CoA:lysophosphatidylglycerol acyltransferase 1-like isoform X1 [Phlebotomus papatasi]XP_055700274.1 acyl-CoA:lysophosphatidylglycerol acyltransferase 1-like isoform X1 [Phlebotomus papatasi]XP_055700275.1 acyl-CoA:lysophosphatidylglycerol acyltransferase 1-like isoform X1 [Phlebotomus papatasi]
MLLSDFGKFVKYPRAVLRFVFIIANNIYCIPTYVVWMVLLLPLRRCHPKLYYRIEGILFHWLLAIVSMWSYTAGYDIIEMGDSIELCKNKKTLVLANHQSTADVPLMMAAFNAKAQVLPNIMWIMDRLFKYTNFGIVSLIHQDFFIASGKANRDKSVDLLKKHLVESYIPRDRRWMVLFPEGGFLRKRREVSQRFAQQNNLPILKHVTLPRVGALRAIMDVFDSHENKCGNNNSGTKTYVNGDITRSSEKNNQDTLRNNTPSTSNCNKYLEYVLDITIAYPNGKPLDLPNIIHGMRDGCQTYFFYRLYHYSEIPKENESLTKWLYDRFVEKEALLENFYKTKSFTGVASMFGPAVVHQDMIRFVIINLFFITSTYFHLQMFYTFIDYYRFYAQNSI